MDPKTIRTFSVSGTVLLIVVTAGGLYGCPQYSVYSAEMAGKAAYARAEQDRQVIVRQAQAQKDAARLLAEAEIERAKGVAEANRIIGASLQGNDAYLRYLWINKLDDSRDRTVIYVPTEAGLPVLEAGRFREERAAATSPGR
ncbi:hypothetical protein [Paracraurococcus lichenis]|uniref:Membrane protease subunit n=1 Tax=Paracraurococcus lichenis TaxID=3064888 RepID=A0ABT9E7B0_9PROT|nr:hypothetical protein [Paracraurococcus sp. LOR1-02]MDO9711840.1 hypothetical protein [Paracraurococcus sp. LOR1-02]